MLWYEKANVLSGVSRSFSIRVDPEFVSSLHPTSKIKLPTPKKCWPPEDKGVLGEPRAARDEQPPCLATGRTYY